MSLNCYSVGSSWEAAVVSLPAMLSSTWFSEVGPIFGFLATFGDSSVEPRSPRFFFLPLLWLDIDTDFETVLRKGKIYPPQKPRLSI